MKQIATLLGICAILFGAWFTLDARFAKCAEFKSLERRVSLSETSTILNQKQLRLWAYEDRYGKDPAKIPDPGDRQEMKQLQVDVPRLQEKVRVLEAPRD